MVTTAEYAKLSQAAYNDTGAPSGWTRLPNSDPNNTGYQGAAFQENGTNVIVVANRGTEPTQLTDLRADLQMGLNLLPGQYQDAQNYLQQVIDANNGADISITGHSLGGALSQLLGAETGLYTETFNPYGAKDLVDELGIDPDGAYPNIHNNQTRFDPVSRLPGSGQLGDMTTYTAASELPAMMMGLPFGLPGVTAASLRSHLLDRFTEEIFNSTPNPSVFDDNKFFPPLPPGSIDTRLHHYPDPKTDPLNNWREELRPPQNPNDPNRPGPTDPNTYRIVWIGDPLALDLDGDGVETVATNAGVLFDHNADGIKTNTGWIKADDGLLVRDMNGNGTIDTGRELFGDSTRLANGQTAAQGFAALADMDANTDGKIDASDATFGELKIWRDLNQDGTSQGSELFTLAELGIQSLGTTGARVSVPVPGGSQILTGSYTKADVDGNVTTATMADLNLTQDTFYSQYTTTVEIPAELADLPDVAGMGRLRNLREAAALSPALTDVLTQYTTAETRTEQKALIGQLLLEWAKTDPSYSEAPVEIIKYFYSDLTYDENSANVIYLRWGQSLPQRVQTSIQNPRADSGLQHRVRIVDAVLGDRVTTRLNDLNASESADINKMYASLADALYADLLIQTRLKKYFDVVELSITDTSISLDTSKVTQMFRDRIAADPVNGLTDLIEFNKYANDLMNGTDWSGPALLDEGLRSQSMTPELQALYQEFNVHFNGVNGGSADDIILGDDLKRTINGGEGNNTLLGGTADETLISGSGSDAIRGGEGNDILKAGLGNDTIDGGKGDDLLYGTDGNKFIKLTNDNDMYLFGVGDGHDTIYNINYGLANSDTIRFKEGVDSDSVRFERGSDGSDDLYIILGDGADSITVKNWFASDYYKIARIEFSDGTVLDAAYVWANLTKTGTEGNDTISGSVNGELITGLGGNDTLVGGSGNDILDGGAGDDLLKGGSGDDVYRFGRGGRCDLIYDDNGYSSNDTIELADGIVPDDIDFRRLGNDLQLAIKGAGDVLTVKDAFNGNTGNRIEQVSFYDGSILDYAVLQTLAVPVTNGGDTPGGGTENILGTAGDDNLVGSDKNSTILGLAGNDTLSGNAGEDSLYGGDGNDVLEGGSGRDYIDAGAGANVIRFEQGTGVDYIRARLTDGQTDTIEFGAGITPADLQVQLGNQRYWNILPGDSGYATLVVGTGDDAFKIEVDGWSTDISRSSVQRFRFNAGTELTLEQVIAMNDGSVAGSSSGDGVLVGSNADDDIYGYDGNDSIRGRAGNDNLNGNGGCDLLDGGSGADYLYGGNGTDVLAGGRGDDTLNGSSGKDIYLFNRGDGNDIVGDNWDGGRKTISFGVGIDPGDISALMDEYGNLQLLVDGGAGGSLTLSYFFQDDLLTLREPKTVEQVQFVAADGSVKVYDLVGLVRGATPQLSAAGSSTPIALFSDAVSYDITFAALPAGGDAVVAYAQSGNLFGSATYYSASALPTGGDDRLVGTLDGDTLEGGAGNDLLYGLDGDDYLDGGTGYDRIDAGAGNDEIYGGSGNDLIMGGEGDDIIQAGPGNDVVYGGKGDDTFIFNAGDGRLTIGQDYDDIGYMGNDEGWYYDENGSNVLRFGAGIVLSDLKFSEQDGYLIIDISSTGDQVRMAGYNPDSPTFSDMVDNYEFADGSMATPQDILDAGIASAGTAGNDDLYGTAGNDSIEGGTGNDYFVTGKGNDRLMGGSGYDTYVFNLGNGVDTIVDISDSGMENRVSFGYGITPDSIRTEVVDGSLILWVGDNGDGIRFEGFDPTVSGMSQTVGSFDFPDGSTMSFSNLLDNLAGAAYQQGGSGSNTYLFNKGDGVVNIFDSPEVGAVNTLKFGPGIAPEDLARHLRFESPAVSGSGTFIIAFDNGDQVRMDGFTPEDVDNSPRSVDTFVFDDGSILSFAEVVRSIFVVEGDDNDNLLTGTNLSDRLYGYYGADTLESGLGSDVLTGGIGNDTLNGGSERDTYVFNLGDGADTVIDAAQDGVGNVASFGPGITKDSLSFTQTGTTLTITYGTSGNAIIIENFDTTGVNGTQVIDTFEFSDGNVLSYRELSNHAPVAAPLANMSVPLDKSFVYQLPTGTFSDIDKDDKLACSATMTNGDPLPSWLTFDTATQTFSGTPATGSIGTIGIQLTAIDLYGATVSSGFNLSVTNGNSAPVAVHDTANVIEDTHTKTDGNVLANDSASDSGMVLTVTSPGVTHGEYGYLNIKADGNYRYQLANSTLSVQALGRDDTVVDSFNYTVTDGTASATSTLDVSITGTNDAPIVVKHLADRGLTYNKNFSFRLPENSFIDIDKGDTLTYSATLANGDKLPDWLKFDAASGTFSGKTPNKIHRDLEIRVTAIDKIAATGNSNGSLSVSDTFSLSVVKGDSWVREVDDQPSHEPCHEWKDNQPTSSHASGKNKRHEDGDDQNKGPENSRQNDDQIKKSDSEQLHSSPAPYLSS